MSNTKILDNTSVGQPLGSFYMYEFAGIDQLMVTCLLQRKRRKVVQTALNERTDKKYVGSLLPTLLRSYYGINV